MDNLAQLVVQIIKAQERVIGPLAVEQAKKVPGLTVDWNTKQVLIKGDTLAVLEELINQYEHLFGQTSIDVCKNAVKGMLDTIPKEQLPPVLTS